MKPKTIKDVENCDGEFLKNQILYNIRLYRIKNLKGVSIGCIT